VAKAFQKKEKENTFVSDDKCKETM